jgi:hypothetical protein
MPILVVSGERFTLSREQATALADHLWQGRQSGAVTAAFQLTQAIKRLEYPSVDGGEPVQFTPWETTALYDALAAVGIVDTTAPPEAGANA